MIDAELAQRVRSALGPIKINRLHHLQHPVIHSLALWFPTRIHQPTQARPRVRRVVLKMETKVRRAPNSPPLAAVDPAHPERANPTTQVFLLDRDAPRLRHPDLFIPVSHQTVKPLSVPRSEIRTLRHSAPTTRVHLDNLPQEPVVHDDLDRITRIPRILRFGSRPPAFPYDRERIHRLVGTGLKLDPANFRIAGYCLHFPNGPSQLTQPVLDSDQECYLIYARQTRSPDTPYRHRVAVLIETEGRHKVVPIGQPRDG